MGGALTLVLAAGCASTSLQELVQKNDLAALRKGASKDTPLCMAGTGSGFGLAAEFKTYERCARARCGRSAGCAGLVTTMSRLAFMAGQHYSIQ